MQEIRERTRAGSCSAREQGWGRWRIKAEAATERSRIVEIGEGLRSHLFEVRKLQDANDLEWIYALLLRVLPETEQI